MRFRATLSSAAALVVLTVALTGTAAARAEPIVPPPPVASWPDQQACANPGSIADPDQRNACELASFCQRFSGTAEQWVEWCPAVADGVLLRRCSSVAPGRDRFCDLQRQQLFSGCPRRPSRGTSGAAAWLCEQYYAAYKPQAPTEAPTNPSEQPATPPATPPPATPPPTTPPPAKPAVDPGAPDIFATLGARSPFCNYPAQLDASARRSCELAGSIAHQFPLSHYGIDVQISTDKAVLQLDLLEVLGSVFQNLGGLIWIAVVYSFKAILLLLEWTFEIPLIADCSGRTSAGGCQSAMPEVSTALRDLHENYLGTPWMLAAFAVAGLWGIWNGLVRQRVSETFGGLVATLALVTAGLVIIANPTGTVGELARLSDQAALGLLSAVDGKDADNSTGSFAKAQEGLFDTLVKRPWCALQFGDVDYCMKARNDKPVSVADIWLSFDAGSVDRQTLYKVTKGEMPDNSALAKANDALKEFGWSLLGTGWPDGENQDAGMPGGEWDQRDRAVAIANRLKAALGDGAQADKVRLQEWSGTPTRLALLLLVIVAQIGAALVLLWIGVRLVFASIAALLLLLALALMLLIAAMGPAGRAACGEYAKQLGAAVGAKFAFALLLMIVILVDTILSRLDIGWIGVWLLQLAFWWGLVMNRGRLLAFAQFDPRGVSGGGRGGGRSGLGLMTAYFGYRALRDVGGDGLRALAMPARRVRAGYELAKKAKGQALGDSGMRRLSHSARSALKLRRDLDRDKAGRLQSLKHGLKRRLKQVRGQLKTAEVKAGRSPRVPQAKLDSMAKRHGELETAQEGRETRLTKAEERLDKLDGHRKEAEARRDAAERAGDKMGVQRYEQSLARIDGERGRAATRVDSLKQQAEAGASAVTASAEQLEDAREQDQQAKALADEAERLRGEEETLSEALQSPDLQWASNFLRNDQGDGDPSVAEQRQWINDRRDAVEQFEEAREAERAAQAEYDRWTRAADTADGDPDRPWVRPDAEERRNEAAEALREARDERHRLVTGDDQLIAGGIEPDAYHGATPERQEELRGQVEASLDQDRRMLMLQDGGPLSRSVERAAELDARTNDVLYSSDLGKRTREAKDQARSDRILRRGYRR